MTEVTNRIEEVRSRRFCQYPKYKDSGVEWLVDIPVHWSVKPVKASLIRNDSGVWGQDFDDNGTIVLRSTEQTIHGAWNIEDPARRRLSAREATYARLCVGDLLVTKSSESEYHIGKTSIVDERIAALNCCFSNFMQRLRVSAEHVPQFFWYFMNCPVAREQFVFLSSSTTGLGNLNGSILGAIRIPMAPAAEQRAITDFLERETAKIDLLVAKKERLIELLQEKRTALITRAVTRGLDRNVPMKDSGVESLGEIPAYWDAGALSRWWTVLDCKHQTVPFLDGGIPVASIGEVHGLSVDLSDANRTSIEEYERMIEGGRAPRIGDIIYSRNATVGEAAIVDKDDAFCMGQDVSLIRSVSDEPLFLLHTLRSRVVLAQLEALVVGSTFKRINVGQIKKFFIAVPPKSEQKDIAQYAQGVYDATASLIKRVREAIDILREFRTALISAAVTGKIDVREAAAR